MKIIEFCMKRLRRISMAGMSAIGGLWTVIEILAAYFPDNELIMQCKNNIFCLIVPAIIVMIVCLIKEIYKIFYLGISYGNVKTGVKIGNILNKSDGIIMIGINNQLVTDEKRIGKLSIHNQLVKKYGQQRLTDIFANNKTSEVREKLFFQERIEEKEFLFLLMSDLDESNVAVTSQNQIGTALESVFSNQNKLRFPHSQKCIYVPALGTGETGRFEAENRNLTYIMKKFLQNEKASPDKGQRKISKLYIVVYWKDIFKVDWDLLYQWVKVMSVQCAECTEFTGE